MQHVVITGIGMVTPLGRDPQTVWRRILAGDRAARSPSTFSASSFTCRVCAEIDDFVAERYVQEVKLVRLMNRDAQLAVAAARLALQDARLTVGTDYLPEDIALFGATGVAGLPLDEVLPLLRASTGEDGQLDLLRFGQAGLRAISPIVSFKILSNMPVCFVSITENVQGLNGIYTPWEGQGAQALDAAITAIETGAAACALAGGCDVKTHELSFIHLQQQGLFDPWRTGAGPVPAEAGVFLVLESGERARQRGARVYAEIAARAVVTHSEQNSPGQTYERALREVCPAGSSGRVGTILGGADDGQGRQSEQTAWDKLGLVGEKVVYPKPAVGNAFAAAAALQVSLAAWAAHNTPSIALADCFGAGSEQAVFRLEGV